MNPLWFVRAAKWGRHPPSDKRVKLVIFVVLVLLGVAALEYFGLWPDWATAERRMR
jgi:hypothetical protein